MFEELPGSIQDFKIWIRNHYPALETQTVERWSEELYGCGPLHSLLEEDDITEIIVQGHEHILYEKNGAFQKLQDAFLTPLTFRNFIFRLMQEAEIRTDLQQPCADGQWRSFRVHLIQRPLVPYEFHLTLRKQRLRAFNLEDLAERAMISVEQKLLLEQIIHEKKNILVVGSTGSGKTTLLNALLLAAKEERVVALEDTKELKMPNSHSVALLTRQDPQGHLKNFDLGDLLRQSLRMRPERLLVGEIRGGEATQLLMALATGHSGSLGTLHAEDPWQALLRLEMLVQIGAPQWNLQSVRQLIWQSLDLILVVEQKDQKRRLKELYQISSLEPHGFLLEPYRCLKPMPRHPNSCREEQTLCDSSVGPAPPRRPLLHR